MVREWAEPRKSAAFRRLPPRSASPSHVPRDRNDMHPRPNLTQDCRGAWRYTVVARPTVGKSQAA